MCNRRVDCVGPDWTIIPVRRRHPWSQPALDVADVGGGRGRVAGERLDGVAQPLRHRRQRLPQSAPVGVECERGVEQRERHRPRRLRPRIQHG